MAPGSWQVHRSAPSVEGFPPGTPLVTPGTLNLENNPKRDLVYALPGQRPHSAHDWAFVILFKVATLKIHMSPGSPYITASSHGAVASISSSQRQGLGAHTPDPPHVPVVTRGCSGSITRGVRRLRLPCLLDPASPLPQTPPPPRSVCFLGARQPAWRQPR